MENGGRSTARMARARFQSRFWRAPSPQTFMPCPADDAKQRMRPRPGDFFANGELLPVPPPEFLPEMAPFIEQLRAGFADRFGAGRPRDFRAVENVPAARRFGMDGSQVARDRGHRPALRAEAVELRMMPVTAGQSAQNLLRQQALPPQGDQPFGIEIFRVHGPQSHPEIVAGFSIKSQTIYGSGVGPRIPSDTSLKAPHRDKPHPRWL